MWVVYEMESMGLIDELVKVVGPFDTREEAEAYADKRGFEVMLMESPIHDHETDHRSREVSIGLDDSIVDELRHRPKDIIK